MFGLTRIIDNTLTVTTSVFTGNLPTQKEVAQLLADGLSIVTIASLFGFGADVIEEIINE